jgi:hypothetical protein
MDRFLQTRGEPAVFFVWSAALQRRFCFSSGAAQKTKREKENRR